MPNQQPSLRFDHREIAVIFCLFVFVSLLMFTVGILVGKGLSQAKFDAYSTNEKQLAKEKSVRNREDRTLASLGTSVSTDSAPTSTVPNQASAPVEIKENSSSSEPAVVGAKQEAETTARIPESSSAKPLTVEGNISSLDLVPKKEKLPTVFGGSLREPDSIKASEAEKILKDPKFKKLLEATPPTGGNKSFPKSYASGKFTVQVGSYPTEKDALERVETLKKIGFPFAYSSPKELGDGKDTWYRVWLGYFPDFQSAKLSGDLLQERGEVKNYLVRKPDSTS